jgi:hypothetical protein
VKVVGHEVQGKQRDLVAGQRTGELTVDGSFEKWTVGIEQVFSASNSLGHFVIETRIKDAVAPGADVGHGCPPAGTDLGARSKELSPAARKTRGKSFGGAKTVFVLMAKGRAWRLVRDIDRETSLYFHSDTKA